MAKTSEIKEKFIELRARGYSYEKISDQIGVSKPTLVKWNRDFSVQIEQMESDEMYALCERFRVARQHRVERFSTLLDRIDEQLANRNLSDVDTDRLVRLFIRVMDAIRREVEPSRMELTGKVAIEDPLERWEAIIRQCIDVEALRSLDDISKVLNP